MSSGVKCCAVEQLLTRRIWEWVQVEVSLDQVPEACRAQLCRMTSQARAFF